MEDIYTGRKLSKTMSGPSIASQMVAKLAVQLPVIEQLMFQSQRFDFGAGEVRQRLRLSTGVCLCWNRL